MFECDVKLSEDGVPFLMHDATLQRTTNAKAKIGTGHSAVGGEHPWSTLSQLDAGSWHSRAFAGEPLPTLDAVAAYCLHNGYYLNIEIKPTPGTERHTGEVVAQHAARLWQGQAVPPLLTSFDPEALEGAQASAPELPRGLLLDTLWTGWVETARRAGLPGHRVQPRTVGPQQRDPGPKRRLSHPELHGERRLGRATPDRTGHRRHHHRPSGSFQPHIAAINLRATQAYPTRARALFHTNTARYCANSHCTAPAIVGCTMVAARKSWLTDMGVGIATQAKPAAVAGDRHCHVRLNRIVRVAHTGHTSVKLLLERLGEGRTVAG